jgi:GntR family transcriptional regulator/MocR family aminotransferase
MQRPLTAAPSVRLFIGLRPGTKQPRRHRQPHTRFSARHGRPRQGELTTIQLADGLRAAAGSGALRRGDRLPSTRALATTLAVSRTVTAAAYEVLQAEGWIGGRRGAGTYVIAAPGLAAPKHSGPPRAQQQEPERGFDLRPGAPWASGMSLAAWRRAWRAAADPPMHTRPVLAGLPEFQAAVVEHLVRHRGLAVQPEAVLATGGSTAALAELAAVLLRPGDVVAVEEPGYPRAVATLRAAGLHVLPAPVDPEGLVVAALPDRARAGYCTPAHQFPLGATLSARRRLALVAWARERAAWVLEDDYDGELRHHGAPLPLLASVGPDVVVHLGTASKILTPTLGVGWLVAPDEVVAAVCAYRSSTGMRPSPAGQRVLTALAVSGDLARHLRRVRRELLARRDLLVGALRAAGLRFGVIRPARTRWWICRARAPSAMRCAMLSARGCCSTGWSASMTARRVVTA